MCEMPKVFQGDWRRANKVHRCVECKLPIRKGDRYYCAKGLWGDDWDVFRQCAECRRLFDLFQENSWDCIGFGELYDSMRDGGDDGLLSEVPGWYLMEKAAQALEDQDFEGTGVGHWYQPSNLTKIPEGLYTVATGQYGGQGSWRSRYFDNRLWLEGVKFR